MLICDGDAKWSGPVRTRLDDAGIRVVPTPFQAPNADGYTERFVRSIKAECLSRVMPFGERHLRRMLTEFVEYYHGERNHQGLGNERIDRAPPPRGVTLADRPPRPFGCVLGHHGLRDECLNVHHKLLILSRHVSEYRTLIDAADLPDLAITSTDDPAAAAASARDCDLALGEPSLLAHVLPVMTRLRWAQSTWAGVEPLLDPSLRRDYVLTNACGVFGGLMSEYVFAYLLARERRILEKYASQQAVRWDPAPPGTLRGKHLGLLGVGSIGSALARTAKHFGMRVNGYTRSSERCPDVDAYFHGHHALVEFARDLDYLVCVMPNTDETRRLVDRRLLHALPPRAVFVNPGRGNVVDTEALAEALRTGRLAAAVLDVFEHEPLRPEHVLWRTPNVLITSHTAALSIPRDIASVFVDNYWRLSRGEPLQCRVDFERGY